MARNFCAWMVSFAACGALLPLPAAAIVGGTSTTEFGQVSSGVQVLPNWVLTARHIGLGVGGTYSNGYGSAVVAARYDAGTGAFPRDDLALLRLATPIAAPSLSLVGTALSDAAAYTLDATLTTGANQSPQGYAFSQVREFWPLLDPDGGGPLTEVPTNWLVVYTDGFTPPYVQGGDSGGGLFFGHVDNLAGGAPLWGIASAYIADEGDSGNDERQRSGYVQLASYRSWLDATLSADLADAQALSWVSTPVPEPASGLLMALGLCAVGRGQRWIRRYALRA